MFTAGLHSPGMQTPAASRHELLCGVQHCQTPGWSASHRGEAEAGSPALAAHTSVELQGLVVLGMYVPI